MDVLFVGNSMTFYNNLEKLVEGIANHHGKSLHCEAVTKGGMNLVYQSTAPEVSRKLSERKWDVVELQDVVGTFSREAHVNGARDCVELLRKSNPDSRIVFYEPWPTKDTILKDNFLVPYCTPGVSLLPYFTGSYMYTSRTHGAVLAPAAEAFYDILVNSGLDFYCADMKHPKPLGSFVSAMCIYYGIFKDAPEIQWTGSDQSFLDSLINENVCWCDNQGKQDSYSLDVLNLISSKSYGHTREINEVITDSTGTRIYRCAAE